MTNVVVQWFVQLHMVKEQRNTRIFMFTRHHSE